MAEGGQRADNDPDSSIRINQQLLRSDQIQSLGVTTERPKFPQYALAVKRKESYNKWPPGCPNLVDELVDAGLVYTGVGDSVRCFYCGGGLRNWEASDDPWVEHAKWYPKCPHVILVMGQSYIDRLLNNDYQRSQTNSSSKENSNENTKSEATNSELLETTAAQSCLQNDYAEAQILKAIRTYMRLNNGATDFKAVEILEIILNEDVQDETTENQSKSVIYSRTDSQEDTTEEEVDALLEENRRLRESQMCKICIDDVANVIFLPCGHMVSCPRCASAVVDCPVCRIKIEGTVKAFFD